MRWIRFGGVLLVAVGVGAGAFLAVRELRSDEPEAVAGLPFDDILPSPAADDEGPLFDGVVNGIRIFPSSPDKSDFSIPACADTSAKETEPSTAYGTELDFEFPGDWKVEFELATMCGDTLVVFHRELNSPIGGVQVGRVRAEHSIGLVAPADQVSAVTLNGKPAAFIAPKELQPGYFTGVTMFVVRESFGLTLITIVNPDRAPQAFELAEQIK
jgi:hypothetical protein